MGDTNVIAYLGPIGVFVLAAWFIWLRWGPRGSVDHLHRENQQKLAAILEAVEGIRMEMMKLNGRLSKMEEWRVAHDKQDDERNEEHRVRAETNRKDIEYNRESVHSLRNELWHDVLKLFHREKT